MTSNEWLGWQDSNLRMLGSKPSALPLGDTPFIQAKITNNQNHRLSSQRRTTLILRIINKPVNY
jgi:hypothetical protein